MTSVAGQRVARPIRKGFGEFAIVHEPREMTLRDVEEERHLIRVDHLRHGNRADLSDLLDRRHHAAADEAAPRKCGIIGGSVSSSGASTWAITGMSASRVLT